MLPIERGANGEPLAIETDRTYWEEHTIQSLCHQFPDLPLARASEEISRLGSRLLRTCRQVSDEVAPYVYGQQQFFFYRPRQALEWLDGIGQHEIRLRHVAILGYSVPYEDNGDVHTQIWASILRRLSNMTSLSCLTKVYKGRWHPSNWSDTIWNNEVVFAALRDLVHVGVMSIGGAWTPRHVSPVYSTSESSLEPTIKKPCLETLILEGHIIAGVEWYPEDYFDGLTALKHLTICHGFRMQSGNSKVSNDFFSHIAPLRSFTWHGNYLTGPHQKAFTTRHGGTLRFLDLSINWKYPEGTADPRSQESACLESLVNMFGALPVLKALHLSHWHDCARLLENMPRSLTVLSLDGGELSHESVPSAAQDEALGYALRKLPARCPRLAHVRLFMDQRVADQDDMGRCGKLSIRTHAALEYLSSRIEDTFFPACMAWGCSTSVPMDPGLTAKIRRSWNYSYHRHISKIDLNRPWARSRADLESVINSK